MFSSITFLLSVILKPAAYLDPGSGSFIIQLLFGAVVGGLVVMRAYWSRIRAYFNKSDQEITTTDQGAPESSDDVQEAS
jgi:NhaP-type Na+/H+ or K+/H+ antiporter